MTSKMMGNFKNEPKATQMPAFAYTIITASELYVADCPQGLCDALFYRHDFMAEVNRFDSIEEANAFISQRYPYYAFKVPGNYLPVMLPQSGTFALKIDPARQALALGMPTAMQPCPTMPMLQQASQTAVQQILPYNPDILFFWSIDCLNGYGITSNDLSCFLEAITYTELVEPHAVLYFDEETASRMAYDEYIRRFYCRYDGRRFHPMLSYRPLKAGEVLYDPGYEEREKAFVMDDTHLGLLMKGLL